jgi:hydrogenase maturation protease
MSAIRTLVAGFGNELRGDDGFGVEVIRRLQEHERPLDGVDLMEIGTAGLRLAQELLTPYERLIIVDAMRRGGAPGSVYVFVIDDVANQIPIDMHLAIPSQALAMAKSLGALPTEVFMVGCEPADVDDLTTELSAPVARSVDVAVAHVRRLLEPRVADHV